MTAEATTQVQSGESIYVGGSMLKATAKGLAERSRSLRRIETDARGKMHSESIALFGWRINFISMSFEDRAKFVNAKLAHLDDTQKLRVIKKWRRAVTNANRAHWMRTHIVRKEARNVHLARMFLMGVPYRIVEKKCWGNASLGVCPQDCDFSANVRDHRLQREQSQRS
jgi:hypothetical protein